ncbi:hypothetical protein R3P38DRAFT_2587766 [Favolaschia claudopus]|uniref:Retrovirus-related Pol polyprotein from transposon TNT 1-94-like beta-barrel domain-containing protein n=1 Tax=Favolaschia claudopus TaxID=2862362 RepID=A0AAV9Z309_9AGAR
MANTASVRKCIAVLDSGATEHCFRERGDFVDYNPVESRTGTAAEGSRFRILATGVVTKTVIHNGQRLTISLDAIHTPDPTTNLISVSRLDAKGYSVEQESDF